MMSHDQKLLLNFRFKKTLYKCIEKENVDVFIFMYVYLDPTSMYTSESIHELIQK